MTRVALLIIAIALSAPPLSAQLLGDDVRLTPAGDGPRLFVTGVLNQLWSLETSTGVSGTLGVGVSWHGLRAHVQAIDMGHLKRRDFRDYWWQAGEFEIECRRRDTDERVDNVFCDGEWSIASAVELLYAFGRDLPVMVGGGYRVGDNTTAFGTVALAFSTLEETFLHVRGSAGRDFAQLGIGIGWVW